MFNIFDAFNMFGYPFYIMLGLIISIRIFGWYMVRDLAQPEKALADLRYALIIFGVIVFALLISMPFFWPPMPVHGEDITTLDKAAKVIQAQNEYLRQLDTRLNEFRMVLFIFLQLAVFSLVFSIYNFAKALVNKNKEFIEQGTQINILKLNDEELTTKIN